MLSPLTGSSAARPDGEEPLSALNLCRAGAMFLAISAVAQQRSARSLPSASCDFREGAGEGAERLLKGAFQCFRALSIAIGAHVYCELRFLDWDGGVPLCIWIFFWNLGPISGHVPLHEKGIIHSIWFQASDV